MRRLLLTISFAFVLFLSFQVKPAFAASRFWVGGSGSWDASSTTHWSASSGGASGASAPGTSDAVTFDGSSGGGTVVVTATQSVASITGGTFTGTLATDGQSITTSGSFNFSGSATRTLNLGGSAIKVNLWNIFTTSNLTFISATSTITLDGLASGAAFQGGGSQTYNNVVDVSLTGSTITFAGSSNTFKNLTLTGPTNGTGGFGFGGNDTITGTLTLAGNSSVNRILVPSDVLGTQRTLTLSGASATTSITNADFNDIAFATASGGPTMPLDLSAITGLSGDCGGNSNITFTAATTLYWVGNTGNASATTTWSSSSGGSAGARVPLPQDDVVLDNGSFNNTGQTASFDMPRMGHTIDFSAYNEGQSPIFSGAGVVHNLYGSLIFNSQFTDNVSFSVVLSGRSGTLANGTSTAMPAGGWKLASGGKTWLGAFTVSAFGGTYQLQDAYTASSNSTLTDGTLDGNGFNWTSFIMTSVGSPTRTLKLGTGTWTFTGTGNVINFSGATNLTLTPSSSTVVISNTTNTSKNVFLNGYTYATMTFAGDNIAYNGSSNAAVSPTFTTLNLNDAGLPNGVKFGASGFNSTTTITTLFTTNATSTGARAIATSSSATIAVLNYTGSGNVCTDYLSVGKIQGSPNGVWFVGANSVDPNSLSSQLTFTACPAGSPSSSTPAFIQFD